MSKIEQALKSAAEESPSLKTLLELQSAYVEASELLQKNQIPLNIAKACWHALKYHAIWMAEQANVDETKVKTLRNAYIPDFPWYETVHVLLQWMPALNGLVQKHIQTAAE